jgi:hypothetical protein
LHEFERFPVVFADQRTRVLEELVRISPSKLRQRKSEEKNGCLHNLRSQFFAMGSGLPSDIFVAKANTLAWHRGSAAGYGPVTLPLSYAD